MDDPTIQPQAPQTIAPAMPAVIEDPTTMPTADPVQAQLAELSARVDELTNWARNADKRIAEAETVWPELSAFVDKFTNISARLAALEQKPAPAPIDRPVVQAEAVADEPAQPQAETVAPATPAADGSIPVGTKLSW